MSATIAATLLDRTVTADGLTFIIRSPRGPVVRTPCQAMAARLSARGWTVAIDSRPEGVARPCRHCGGEHR